MNKKVNPRIVTVGGGTGTFVVLSGLKDYPLNLSSIVTMMDSGGSTGRLRDQLGVLPPGDLRQALVALSDSKEIWRKLFTYRFESGDLKGHNFGNIFISALEKITGSTAEAINLATEILQTKGNVYPVTLSNCTLCAGYADGSVVEGESNIEEIVKEGNKITRMYLTPSAVMNLEAKKELENADFIIFGPGDLYTSIIPNLLVEGMPEVLAYSRAKKIFILNVMTRYGQTDGFKSTDFIFELERYLGGISLDYIFINETRPSQEVLDWYREVDKAHFVEDTTFGGYFDNRKILRGDFLSKNRVVQAANDHVKRSLIRHDPDKIAEAIYKLVDREF